MPPRRLALVFASVVFLLAAKQRAVHHPAALPPQPPADVWTYSNVVATSHLALDLTVDFENRQIDEWLYQPRLPSNVTAATSSAIYTRAEQRANAFAGGTPIAELSPSTWTDDDIEYFFQLVPAAAVSPRLAEIDAALHFSSRTTPPERWLFSAIRANYTPAMDAVERALMRGGPNGTIQGLYSALVDVNPAYARAMFTRYRDRYERNVQDFVESILRDANALRDAA